jgi:hypothetical protein
MQSESGSILGMAGVVADLFEGIEQLGLGLKFDANAGVYHADLGGLLTVVLALRTVQDKKSE